MSQTVLVDMDGVLVNFTEASLKKVKELYGVELQVNDMVIPKTSKMVWDYLTDEQKEALEGDHRNIYDQVCPAGFFESLSPFEGAVEAVKKLYNSGFNILFLTKPLNWERSAPEKAAWLKKHFQDIKYSIMMIDKMSDKHLVCGDYIIDDDTRVIEGVNMAIPILVRRPWNKTFRESEASKNISMADSLEEAVDAIIDTHEVLQFWTDGGLDAPKTD